MTLLTRTTEEECPLCFEPFDSTSSSVSARSKVFCSAQDGCRTFCMCRLCVFRQALHLATPVLLEEGMNNLGGLNEPDATDPVDEAADNDNPVNGSEGGSDSERNEVDLSNLFTEADGDFVALDPTACPQCKRVNAFLESELPPLPEEVKRFEEGEIRRKRNAAFQRVRETAMRRLREARLASVQRHPVTSQSTVSDSSEENTVHENIRVLCGPPGNFFVRRNGSIGLDSDGDILVFKRFSTIGIPDSFTTSGVLYYELEIMQFSQPPDDGVINVSMPNSSVFQFGVSLLNGTQVTENDIDSGVGEGMKSWGFDAKTGQKIHVLRYGDERLTSQWQSGCTIGIAVNLNVGKIAVSGDGKWDLANGYGVKFEDRAIKLGVYPCISGKNCTVKLRAGSLDSDGSQFKFGPPPDSLWESGWAKYEDDLWVDLPENARAAAMTIGYTQRSWMREYKNPIEDKLWSELTEEEQAAAKILGCDENIWNQLSSLWNERNADDDDSSSSDSESASIDSYGFSMMQWIDLPDDARRAADILGYTATSWNSDFRVPLDHKSWNELTAEQQRAAIVLGYDEEAWNNDDAVSSDDSTLCFYDMGWFELPSEARAAAVTLGYTPSIWDDDLDGPFDDKSWADLDPEQRQAAVTLGYNEDSWNDDSDSTSS